VADWNWVEDKVEADRKKGALGFLGVKEAHEGTVHFWRPFWAAGVSFSRAEGAVFQKGSEKQALLLLDALSPSSARVSLLEDERGGPFEAALHRDVIDNRLTLPSLTDEAAAKRMLESWARGRTDLPHARVRVRGLIYLPAIVAQYSSKHGSRTQESTLAEQIFEDTSGLRAATVKFVEAYARLA
jgi:hypothetical protein